MITKTTARITRTSAILAITALAVRTAPAGQPDERVRWHFEFASPVPGWFTAVGADGTVYASDFLRLYALSPDGTLQWSIDGAGSTRPISVGADGTIYAAVEQVGPDKVIAVNPDGSIRWEFTLPTSHLFLAGPNVGPDGDIYAVQAAPAGTSDLGFFSLDPDGALRWSDWGSPPIVTLAIASNSAIKFGPGRMYAGIVVDSGGPPVLYAFDLGGDQLWTSSALLISGGTYPQVDSSGRIFYRWGQIGMQAITPGGAVDWISTHPSGVGILNMPAVGPDGTSYTGDWLGLDLWAINPDGTTRWLLPSSSGQLSTLAVPPDDALLLVGGNGGFGQPGWIRGYDNTDGAMLWQVDLPTAGGLPQSVMSMEQSFSPDSKTAYLTTRFNGDVANASLYAIDLSATPGGPAADLDHDGAVGFSDLLMLLGVWGPCAPGPCAADLDASGAVGFGDLLMLLGAWS